ncbi:MAG: hypothetical protein JXR94_13755 [Candidatus Hydrogenedentes bacterium]|nr:hypothetical protein [Candidatus Hydrogenedentota bacterium]
MKSAYELAMERLNREAGPTKKLSDEQKAEIAEIDNKYEARIAEAQLSFDNQIAGATSQEEADQLRQGLAESIASIEAERDRAREAVWQAAE